MKLSWNWLKEFVPVKRSPEEIGERLTMAGFEVKRVEKIGDDYLLETEVTSNRPDWLSHIGVAREIAAIYNLSLRLPSHQIKIASKSERKFNVKTLRLKLCPFYSAVILENLESVRTPKWMEKRLQICGIRSIHFLVDVTNYVLLEYGQPLHAFDLEKLHGSQITARAGKPNEKIVAIDGNSYDLNQNDVVIADIAGPVALGGVMGGKDSEVSSNTKHILLEAALFSQAAIRRTSRRLKISSESSYRFERGVDPGSVVLARDRAVYLLAQYAKAKRIGNPLCAGKIKAKKHQIVFPSSDIRRVLGPVSIPVKKAALILNHLEIPCKVRGLKLACSIPSFRSDISMPEDLIEEVARIYGYDQIPETFPQIEVKDPKSHPILELSDRARDLCAGMGLQEIVTFSLVNPETAHEFFENEDCKVRIENPRNQYLTLMRPTLAGNFLEVIRDNLNVGNKSIAIFEVGNRYLNQGGLLPFEERVLGIGLTGEKPWNWLDSKRAYDLFDLKGMIQRLFEKLSYPASEIKIDEAAQKFFTPLQAFRVSVHNFFMGSFGLIQSSVLDQMKIEKPVLYGEISLTELLKIKKHAVSIKEIPAFPSVERDLALVVNEEVKAGNLADEARFLGEGLIQDIQLFDLYRGGKLPKGKKSVAFRMRYQSAERTLQAAQVNELHFSIIDALCKKYNAELPSKN